jgi:hypothetical protein
MRTCLRPRGWPPARDRAWMGALEAARPYAKQTAPAAFFARHDGRVIQAAARRWIDNVIEQFKLQRPGPGLGGAETNVPGAAYGDAAAARIAAAAANVSISVSAPTGRGVDTGDSKPAG